MTYQPSFRFPDGIVPSGFAARADGSPSHQLGAALKAKRERDKSSARTVAGALRITVADLSDLERGTARPEGALAERVGEWLGWTPDTIALAARVSPDEG